MPRGQRIAGLRWATEVLPRVQQCPARAWNNSEETSMRSQGRPVVPTEGLTARLRERPQQRRGGFFFGGSDDDGGMPFRF
jgi:hypothetical protein